jgi:hypothetical protein
MSQFKRFLDEAHQTVKQSRPIPWYIRMWAAVVRRAVVDWVLYREHTAAKLRKLGQDADKWLFDDIDNSATEIASFLAVCDILDVDPGIIRERIKRLSEEDARKLRGMEFGDEW